MDKAEIRQVLLDAAELAEVVDERYRPAAFRFAAERLAVTPVSAAASSAAVVPLHGELSSVQRAVNEVLAGLRDRSHTDKFEAIIFHSLTSEGAESLTIEAILSAYAMSRMARPTNPSDIIAKCARRGHVTEGSRVDGQKTWRLTASGERYVRQLLQEIASE
jgi:hypothetical protein